MLAAGVGIRHARALTYTSIAIDGTIEFDPPAAGGTSWESDEQMANAGSTYFYLTWDATYIYVAFSGPDLDVSDIALAFDTTTGGATDEMWGAQFDAPFAPEFFVGVTDAGYMEYRYGNESGWQAAQDVTSDVAWSLYAGGAANANSEIRIPRSWLGNHDPSDGFAVAAWTVNNAHDQVLAAFPTAAEGGPSVPASPPVAFGVGYSFDRSGTNVAPASEWLPGPSRSHYVSPAGDGVWPYLSWVDAATNIQDAIDAAQATDTVLVSNGVYSSGGRVALTEGGLTNRVCITNAITVRSVNGPGETFIVGAASPGDGFGPGAVRCAYVTPGAVLSGFALTNGHTRTDESSDGGGVYMDNAGIVSNCLIAGCAASGSGGGVYAEGDALLVDSTICGNAAGDYGGGVYCDGGQIDRCVVRDNEATYDGGGVEFYYNSTGNGLVANSLVVGNTANGWGGGIDNYEGGHVRNCTVVSNVAGGDGGGVYSYYGSNYNCIIYGNHADVAGSNLVNDFHSLFAYCCTDPTDISETGVGSITNDPQFVNAAGGDYRLQAASACVNAGSTVDAAGSLDLDRSPRVVHGIVDIGAYELQPPGNDHFGNACVVSGLSGTTNGHSRTASGELDEPDHDKTLGPTNSVWWTWTAPQPGTLRVDTFGSDFDTVLAVYTGSTVGALIEVAWADDFDGAQSQVDAPVSAGAAYYVAVDGFGVDTGIITLNWEFIGLPLVTITNPPEDIVVDLFTGNYTVAGTNTEWVIDTMWWTNALTGAGGSLSAGSAWDIPGIALGLGGNLITVWGTNLAGVTTSDTVTITQTTEHQGYSPVHYAWDLNPSPQWPYTNWQTAAQTIQEAADTAGSNDTVLVTNGAYAVGGSLTPGALSLQSRVVVERPMHVRSVNGAAYTRIEGEPDMLGNGPMAVRCVYLGFGAMLDGFTLTNGYTDVAGGMPHNEGGGGALIDYEGAVSNCLVVGNSSQTGGGGVLLNQGGRLSGCLVRGNTSNEGGGVLCEDGGEVTGCTVAGNNAAFRGGGVVCSFGGVVRNSVISSNDAPAGTNWYNYNAPQIAYEYCCTVPVSGLTNALNCVEGDPDFVDAPAGNYRLLPTSSCLDKGANAHVATATDLDGNPRIVNGTVDIGVFEIQPPGNDNFTNAYLLTGNLGVTNGYSMVATAEPGEPDHAGRPASRSLWWSWTAPRGDRLWLDTNGSDFDTVLGVYTGAMLSGLVEVASDDDDGDGLQSALSTPVEAGNTYHFAVASYGNTGGNVTLRWRCGTAPSLTITNPAMDVIVSYETVSYAVQGTGIALAGALSWSNSLTGGTGLAPAGDNWEVAGVALDPGDNVVTVSGTNDLDMVASDQVTITRTLEHWGTSPIHYVSTNGWHIWPYTNWLDAATNIQDAVDAASSNETVLVSNGVYNAGGRVTPGAALVNRVCVTHPIALRGVSGGDRTFIAGEPDPVHVNGPDAVRCVYLAADTQLSGFTLMLGHTAGSGANWKDSDGAGIFIYEGQATISNCTISACAAGGDGGGLYSRGPTLATSLTVCGNSAQGSGGGVLCDGSGTISGSTIVSNSAGWEGGGVRFEGTGGKVVGCTIDYNEALGKNGGGVDCHNAGLVDRCVIRNNTAADLGGGVGSWNGEVRNSLLTGNWAAARGGGVYNTDGLVVNCTIVDNSAGAGAGGLYAFNAGITRLCVIYSNHVGAAHDNWTASAGTELAYCCTAPLTGLPGATGSISNSPVFADYSGGDYRLLAWSPGVDDGTNAYAAGTTDLAGVQRILGGTVDMGCYEFAPIRYVSRDGLHRSGYITWQNAATNIQAAVDAGPAGTLVLVTNGVYDTGGRLTPGATSLWSRVVIDKAVTVESVHDAVSTFIVGESHFGTNGPNAMRCVYMADGAELIGFTVTNGHTHTIGAYRVHDESGGGVFLDQGGIVSNCTIRSSSANSDGGGVFCTNGGQVVNCTLRDNVATVGGGAAVLHAGDLLECTIHDNRGDVDGGGIAFFGGGSARGCTISQNSSDDSGGVFCLGGGVVDDCIVSNNTAESLMGAGGVWMIYGGGVIRRSVIAGNVGVGNAGIGGVISDGVVENCLILNNFGEECGGICNEGFVNNCTIVANSAVWGSGGVTNAGTMVNCIVYDNSGGNWTGSGNFDHCCTLPTNGLPAGSVGCIESDPLFVDAIGENYRLGYGSPCIETGTDVGTTITNDLDGKPRPIDGDFMGLADFDIGCYEYDPWGTDTDGDGVSDGDEVVGTHTSPTNTNTDGDVHDDYQEMIADTDGADSNDYFRIEAISNVPPMRIYFESSAARYYRLHITSNLVTGAWAPVAGQEKTGSGGPGPDSLADPNAPVGGRSYRVTVELP